MYLDLFYPHSPKGLNIIENDAYRPLAEMLIKYPWHIILVSGILAGWLMGLLSWLITSSQETISRIIIITLITSVIGIGGLHHAIVESIEVFTALLTSKSITIGRLFACTIMGNHWKYCRRCCVCSFCKIQPCESKAQIFGKEKRFKIIFKYLWRFT